MASLKKKRTGVCDLLLDFWGQAADKRNNNLRELPRARICSRRVIYLILQGSLNRDDRSMMLGDNWFDGWMTSSGMSFGSKDHPILILKDTKSPREV